MATAEASQSVRMLEPHALWNRFADLNAVPRGSKKEERVIQFMKDFGEGLGLETNVDAIGNVIIRKAASTGFETRIPVVLQSHLDIVWQKNSETSFDFETQGIEMVIRDDWVHANGTTLGADNGIGVASIMAILAAQDIPHPSLEALFTIDEETGMTGANGLVGGLLDGKIMLNLDTEDDTELTIGCAGGVNLTARRSYSPEPATGDQNGFRIELRGLTGGHSGMDIHLGRGNSNKLMNRILWNASKHFGLRVSSIDGGGLLNAIPRESTANVTVPSEWAEAFTKWLDGESATLADEYKTTDPELEIRVEPTSIADLIPANVQRQLLGAVYSLPNGIHRMSPDVDDLVQTSNNLARVLVKDGSIEILCLTRSSVNSERDDLANAISAGLELTESSVELSARYPGWKPVPESTIVKLMSGLYEEMFGESAHVAACHAGLECGIVGNNYPEMEMISFGPNIRGAHSPDERVQISSVQKFWKFLLATLERIPADTERSLHSN